MHIKNWRVTGYSNYWITFSLVEINYGGQLVNISLIASFAASDVLTSLYSSILPVHRVKLYLAHIVKEDRPFFLPTEMLLKEKLDNMFHESHVSDRNYDS